MCIRLLNNLESTKDTYVVAECIYQNPRPSSINESQRDELELHLFYSPIQWMQKIYCKSAAGASKASTYKSNCHQCSKSHTIMYEDLDP